MTTNPIDNLRLAKKGPIVSIVAYLVLSISKLIAGYLLNANSLIADGFNNLSDIVGNVALLVGLHMASQPADANHRFGHWKFEDLSSLITSFIMFMVGFQVLIQTVQAIIIGQQASIDPLGALVGAISALIMLGVYLFNKRLSKKVKSSALVAASKDNLSDALTSIATSIAIITAALKLPIIDKIVAIIIGLLILKTAFGIFMESAFSLSDGFDNRQLKKYKKAILEIPKITAVKSQRGRTYGSNVYLDIVLEMNPDLSVYESHAITERVEKLLSEKFAVYDIDIHVEPSLLPDDEILDNVAKKLYRNEKIILSKIPDFERLLSKEITWIDGLGQVSHYQDIVTHQRYYPSDLSNFKIYSISQQTKMVTYDLSGSHHTSIWRRNELWYLVFHQITPKENPYRFKKHYQIHRKA
ncbi:cation diffusion facilitator family transporter [Streptococcus phocae]|uniref:Cation transporter n=1 Tax=Streptococcus phocae TaxID=119224 RepID=A0A0N8FXI7_9STRE|nr:cation diffusion facilitator family transporter [Streptococcus phocae]KPJ23243.1 cation transporter [Streptococcus phocae]